MTLKVAEVAFAIIKATLEKGVKNGVLIHCWGGINRSGATAVAFLATQCLGSNDKILHQLMPLLIRFYCICLSQRMQDFFHQQYEVMFWFNRKFSGTPNNGTLLW